MEKDLKGGGQTHDCPSCLKTLIIYYDDDSISIKCENCGTIINIATGWKRFFNFKTITKAAAVILIIVSVVIFSKSVLAKRINCQSFKTQQQAQAMFNSNPTKYKDLDNGGIIGKACESLR